MGLKKRITQSKEHEIKVYTLFFPTTYISGQITIIPKPELRAFWGEFLTKPPFGVTSAEVVIICPDIYIYIYICNAQKFKGWPLAE